MLKWIFPLIILISAIPTLEAQVKWYTFDEAMKQTKLKPKKIFIDVYTDWCSWCKVMDKNTFNDPKVAAYLNKNYYPVKFNAESTAPVTFEGKVYKNTGRTHELAVALLNGNLGYPSVAWLDEKNQLLGAIAGYKKPDEIMPMLVYLGENHYKSTKWDAFIKNYKPQ